MASSALIKLCAGVNVDDFAITPALEEEARLIVRHQLEVFRHLTANELCIPVVEGKICTSR